MNPLEFLDEIDGLIDGFPVRVFDSIQPFVWSTLNLVLLIYIVYVGFSLIAGRNKTLGSVGSDFLWLGVIMAVATVWAFLTDAFYGIFSELPYQIAGAVVGGDANTLAEFLNRYWDAAVGILGLKWGALSWRDIGQMLALIFLGYLPTLLILVPAVFLMAIAKFGIAILFGLLPMFLFFLWSEKTQEFFMGYLRQLFNFMMVPILIGLTLTLGQDLLEQSLRDLASTGELLDALLTYAFISGVLFLIIMQTPNIAGGIAGGVALGTLGAGAWAYAKGKAWKQSLLNRGLDSDAPGSNRLTRDAQGNLRGRSLVGAATNYIKNKVRPGGIERNKATT